MNRSGWNTNGSPRYSRPCSGLVRLPDSGRLIDFGGLYPFPGARFLLFVEFWPMGDPLGENALLVWGPAEMPKLWGWLVD